MLLASLPPWSSMYYALSCNIENVGENIRPFTGRIQVIEAHAKGMQNTHKSTTIALGLVLLMIFSTHLANPSSTGLLMSKRKFSRFPQMVSDHMVWHSFTQFIIHYLNSGRSHRSTKAQTQHLHPERELLTED